MDNTQAEQVVEQICQELVGVHPKGTGLKLLPIIKAALLTERQDTAERCAKIAESYIPDPHEPDEACKDCWLQRDIAAAIRNQGKKA